ncbi:xanthine dehydrogenase accessory protein XdhC [Chelativorans sp. Marseille-P2723]|uniref:xanthine dehydrogenase accessory protein XdhC n=1 Tax=Chelativorans sp. Marseille-P2723 TaxID=2709133 RepID=UPI00156FE24B|nr:xanthine dehydrogenase accessory protein XdhC [Chelativorans sp. Marseille-P2723]
MSAFAKHLKAFLTSAPDAAVVTISQAKGSTPREEGAWMLVSREGIFGTIGGGQLEYLAIGKARELIEQNIATGAMNIPLGPEIGQCCGGRVALDIRIAGPEDRRILTARAQEEDGSRPNVYVFGCGHVGRALASALALLPLRTTIVETRAEMVEEMPPEVKTVLTAVPEEAVRSAPAGSAFVVLTHDHALDFLIVAEALARDDAAYVGMIGSKTKKATFRSWYLKNGGEEQRFSRLITPIGGADVKDKRPAIIAALTAAEILKATIGATR